MPDNCLRAHLHPLRAVRCDVDSAVGAEFGTGRIGVSLSISREGAEKLAGRLTVETEVGVGSTFTLGLPAVSG
jgi:light-regulated signal transduction histidine kinase (bacteriophytochrome)